MGIDQRLAPIEFCHHRQKQGGAEPFVAVARHQADAVGLERVERIGDLLQAAVDIGQRHRCETAEASGMVRQQLGRIFVALARKLAGGVA
jgi:hypothetical protein